jgi:hypothetical protein
VIGRIAIRGTPGDTLIAQVLRAHWAGAPEVDAASVPGGTLALQSGETDELGFVAREVGGWTLLADSEDATADAAVAAELAESLALPVLWVCTVDDAARVTWFGADDDAPDEAQGPAAVEAWLDANLPGWRTGWTDPGGTRWAFGKIDADLYVDDSAWLVAADVNAGAIQVRAAPGVDPTAVAREVAAYWLDCGARPGGREVPTDACGVVTRNDDRLVVAVSPEIDGWIAIVDSEREVADLGLADWLAATLDADVAWYWVDSETGAAALRLFGFDALDEEPADEPASVVVFAGEMFPVPFPSIDEAEGWQLLGFAGVDADWYVTDPEWLDQAPSA